MDAIELLSAQIKQAHMVASGTVSDLTPEQAAWSPGGEANPIAAELIHLISAEDMFLNMMVGRQPLGMGAFAGKTGASEPHPMGGYGDWAKAREGGRAAGQGVHGRGLQEYRGVCLFTGARRPGP